MNTQWKTEQAFLDVIGTISGLNGYRSQGDTERQYDFYLVTASLGDESVTDTGNYLVTVDISVNTQSDKQGILDADPLTVHQTNVQNVFTQILTSDLTTNLTNAVSGYGVLYAQTQNKVHSLDADARAYIDTLTLTVEAMDTDLI